MKMSSINIALPGTVIKDVNISGNKDRFRGQGCISVSHVGRTIPSYKMPSHSLSFLDTQLVNYLTLPLLLYKNVL